MARVWWVVGGWFGVGARVGVFDLECPDQTALVDALRRAWTGATWADF